jgi:Cys-Gly metallodipeptidase DUG1
VNPLIERYLRAEFATLGSKNTLSLESLHGGKPWVASTDHWSYAAAARATQAVYGRAPDLTREGGSIPVTLTFADALNVNVLLLPMGRGDDGAHSTNEKLDRSNFIEGVSACAVRDGREADAALQSKLLGSYLWEISAQA